ncbi:protein NRT1/ PTR FAMILY 2.8-like isoform X1 [Trifolium pratense]|uniref:protein NRT1/ PTR FAMILY 2.8-like isoform X1 n=1 Tax=Trifolium pratense TaxID=57577 RepID=UPI001E694315|nr:protein NRT1/ PTR FAMILY 2.8-like isoform X1 [Trifolium pratense]
MEENVVNTNSTSSSLHLQHDQEEEEASSRDAGGWRSVKYIIGNESFEKLASMSLISNLTVYLLTNYNLSGLFVVNVVQIWNGCSNIASIVGAFISDTYLGRFKTLLYGCIASLLGILTITLTAGIHQLRPISCKNIHTPTCQHPQNWQLGVLFAGLGLLSIGAGGIRPCNIAFGADQFDTKTKKGRLQLESFFNWWYFTFTIALVIALTGVVYIQTNVSWTLGFAIPTTCLAFSITIFLLGHKTYVYKKPQGSVFTDIAKVISAACRKLKLQLSDKPLYDPVSTLSESDNIRLVQTGRFKFLDKAAIIADPSELNNEGIAKNGWRLCSLQQVEHLKCLLGVLPVWVTGICFFIVMDQKNTFGVLQVIQTDRSIGPHFKVPPGWMNLVSMLALAFWICIYECFYIRIMRRINKTAPRRISMAYRIRIGILLSILSMLVAAITEKKRRDLALKHGLFASPVSFGLLLPQFALSGFSEAFATVAIMEYFTLQLPESMRTVAGAVFFLSLSIANYIGSLIVNVVHIATSHKGQTPWLGGHDINHNRLDCYYYLIASLGVLNFIYFHFFASHYLISSKDTEKAKVQDDEDKAMELEIIGTI